MNNFFNPLITIILPCYNGQKFLSQSIESILNQTYTNIELIIVNDCSTDDTLKISNKYAEKDSRIKIINNKENKKLPASLNIGHKEAKGDFITWTSDDNFYENNAIEILLEKILYEKADVIYSNFNLINDKGVLVRKVNLLGIENIFFGNFICCCFLYKKEVYEKNGGYNEDYFLIEDYDFWLRAIKHCKFYQLKEFLYNYRTHDKSLTNQIVINEEKNILWKKNINEMFISFWENFSKKSHLEIAELSIKSLLSEEINFNWLITNNQKIKNVKAEIKKNLNFHNGSLIEKVFLNKIIESLIHEKDTKNNYLKFIFIIRNYAKALDKNAIKTLIKYSFFK